MQESTKKVWIQFSHEHNEDDTEHFDNVLSTTPEGLEVLISDLNKISSLKTHGRHEIDTSNYDERYGVPIKFIELRSEPYALKNKSNWEGKLIILLIIGILLLSVYGAFDLIRTIASG